jgi:hypothetical protein
MSRWWSDEKDCLQQWGGFAQQMLEVDSPRLFQGGVTAPSNDCPVPLRRSRGVSNFNK